MNAKVGLYDVGPVELALLDLPKPEIKDRCNSLSATRFNGVITIEWLKRPRQDGLATQTEDDCR